MNGSMKHVYINILLAGIALFSLGLYIHQTRGSIGSAAVDDAYMITRYAKHWLTGDGFSWNKTDGPSYGVTSPAYLFVITAVLALTGPSDSVALTYTSYVAGLLSMLIIVYMGFLIKEESKWGQKLWIPLLVVPFIFFLPPFKFHSLTGMETTFSLLANSLLACSILITARQRSIVAFMFCLFSGVLSFATRPDNGIYALVLPPLFFLATDRSMRKYSVKYAIFFAFIAGSMLILYKFLFNDFFPLPFFAKSSGFYKGYLGVTSWNAMEHMIDFLTLALPYTTLIAITASKNTFARLAAIAITILATFSYYATVTQIMGWVARYYYPSIAFIFLATFLAVFNIEPKSPIQAMCGALRRHMLVPSMVLLPLLLLVAFKPVIASQWEKYMVGIPYRFQSITQYQKSTNDQLPTLGWEESIFDMGKLLQHVPQEIVITASEHGWLSSQFPELTIIDLIGLHDRTITHYGFSAAYVISRQPDLIWFPHPDYTYEVAQILDNPTFIRDYEYYPGAWDYGIAINKKSVMYSAIKSEVSTEFSQIYSGLSLSDYLARPSIPPDHK